MLYSITHMATVGDDVAYTLNAHFK